MGATIKYYCKNVSTEGGSGIIGQIETLQQFDSESEFIGLSSFNLEFDEATLVNGQNKECAEMQVYRNGVKINSNKYSFTQNSFRINFAASNLDTAIDNLDVFEFIFFYTNNNV